MLTVMTDASLMVDRSGRAPMTVTTACGEVVCGGADVVSCPSWALMALITWVRLEARPIAINRARSQGDSLVSLTCC